MTDGAGVEVKSSTGTAAREISSIAFPYDDLAAATDVVKVLHTNAGGGEASMDQLAGWMKQTVTSGAFRTKVSAARLFGLLENSSRGSVRITNLGAEIIDESRARDARARAFLNVPLYAAIFEKYKGMMLPPVVGLEREIANLGVSSKQKDKARQVMERSAQQAGYFDHGKDRLVRPGTATVADPPTASTTPPEAAVLGGSGRGGGNDGELHPFIEGLLKTLPEPGGVWAVRERARWLQTAAGIFGLIYTGDGEITVQHTESALKAPEWETNPIPSVVIGRGVVEPGDGPESPKLGQ